MFIEDMNNKLSLLLRTEFAVHRANVVSQNDQHHNND